MNEIQKPLKDENAAGPIASAWRPVLREIVAAFARGDYPLERGLPGVSPISAEKADQIRNYIASYGETVTNLPEEAWTTSECQWMGTHWELLVDLWTVESGESDLVLNVRVFEHDGDFRYEVDSVHVP
jgi:hypothetical protein